MGLSSSAAGLSPLVDRSPRRPRPRRPSPRAWRAGLSPVASGLSAFAAASRWRLSSLTASVPRPSLWRASGRLRPSPRPSPRPLRPPRPSLLPSGRPSPRPSALLSVRASGSRPSAWRPSPRSPPRSPRRPPRRPSPRPSDRPPSRPPSRRSPGLPVVLRAGVVSGAVSEPPNKDLSQPKKPFSAGAGAAAVAAARGAAGGVRSGLAGRASAGGAGNSGNTPLMTGVCLLVGSCERRVTEVGSSNSSAIL
ncbi:MAG: hypothetical protein RLZZ470_673 [Pseudomonadota bacterium]